MLCKSALLVVALCLQTSQCFQHVPNRARSTSMSMNTEQKPSSQRSSFLANALASLRFAAFAGSSAILATSLTVAPAPVHAISVSDANTKLAGYDLPPIIYMPKNFSPLVSTIMY
jgi:hypothetical protein